MTVIISPMQTTHSTNTSTQVSIKHEFWIGLVYEMDYGLDYGLNYELSYGLTKTAACRQQTPPKLQQLVSSSARLRAYLISFNKGWLWCP